MTTNADITIYNHKYNKDTRMDDWHRTEIRGVHFYVDHKVAPTEKGLVGADVYKIRIPEKAECKKEYIPEDEYAELEDVSGKWTIRKGDIIVRGICEIEIEKPSDLKMRNKDYCKVTSWSDNRFGSSPHWRIGGM